MGVRLLNRGRQGIEPTPHGRVLIERSRTIFDELRQGLNEIEYLSDPTAGELRIAASVPMAAGHGKAPEDGRPPAPSNASRLHHCLLRRGNLSIGGIECRQLLGTSTCVDDCVL